MSIYEYNEEAARKSLTEMGYEQGWEDGESKTLIKNVDSIMKNLNLDLQRACEAIGITQDEYTRAKSKL